MTSLKRASSAVLVLIVSACGGTVGLGDMFDGGAGGTSNGTSSSGPTSGGTTSESSGSGTTTGGTTTAGSGGSIGTTGGTTTGGTGGAGGAGGGGEGSPCAAFTRTNCAAGFYCDYLPTDACGGTDAVGVCRRNAEICTADCPGVCGCDGKFYCNACNAQSNGVDDSVSTTCFPSMPGSDAGVNGKVCGGLVGARCDGATYCDYPANAACGIADATGVCRPRPQACTADCPGACGCDGKFYCNACAAAVLGIDVNEANSSCSRDR